MLARWAALSFRQRRFERGAAVVSHPRVFRRHPEIKGRTFRVSRTADPPFAVGEELLLRWCEDELRAFRGRIQAGVVPSPPPALLDAVRQSGGVLCARVAHVHPRSGAADVTVIP